MGAQIDLLIYRADRTINICEVKFYNGKFVIDKSYGAELGRKLTVFRRKNENPQVTLFNNDYNV
jgi:hypothetical protein